MSPSIEARSGPTMFQLRRRLTERCSTTTPCPPRTFNPPCPSRSTMPRSIDGTGWLVPRRIYFRMTPLPSSTVQSSLAVGKHGGPRRPGSKNKGDGRELRKQNSERPGCLSFAAQLDSLPYSPRRKLAPIFQHVTSSIEPSCRNGSHCTNSEL